MSVRVERFEWSEECIEDRLQEDLEIEKDLVSHNEDEPENLEFKMTCKLFREISDNALVVLGNIVKSNESRLNQTILLIDASISIKLDDGDRTKSFQIFKRLLGTHFKFEIPLPEGNIIEFSFQGQTVHREKYIPKLTVCKENEIWKVAFAAADRTISPLFVKMVSSVEETSLLDMKCKSDDGGTEIVQFPMEIILAVSKTVQELFVAESLTSNFVRFEILDSFKIIMLGSIDQRVKILVDASIEFLKEIFDFMDFYGLDLWKDSVVSHIYCKARNLTEIEAKMVIKSWIESLGLSSLASAHFSDIE
jgi:hypothetical protein